MIKGDPKRFTFIYDKEVMRLIPFGMDRCIMRDAG